MLGVTEPEMTSQVKIEAAEDAKGIIETIWAKDLDSIPLPVDPVRIAQSLGIQVFDEKLPDSVSGAIVNSKKIGTVILLSQSDTSNRKRFSCAHEIGHFVRKTNKLESFDYEYVDYRGALASEGRDVDEIYANEFAASLLMPEQTIRKFHEEGKSPSDLMAVYKVSNDAIVYRLKHLGLTSS
jgi:Zn-dependent peptidase ImmA (M78 family)